MGDRTHVELTVLVVHQETVDAIMDKAEESCDEFFMDKIFVVYHFHEVNYGEIKFLPDLVKAGIAYDSEWGAGSEYTAGQDSCRFNEKGEVQLLNFYDVDQNVPLSNLLEIIDDHEALKKAILDHKEKVVPWPWDNQEEYGKLFQARQLIEPKEVSGSSN